MAAKTNNGGIMYRLP